MDDRKEVILLSHSVFLLVLLFGFWEKLGEFRCVFMCVSGFVLLQIGERKRPK